MQDTLPAAKGGLVSRIVASARTSPIELLQALLRFDTSNPPGGEGPCIDYLDGVLSAGGVQTRQIAKEPQRPNLIARLPGAGRSSALLFCGHVDVVPAEPAEWTHPPFAGEIAEGFAWGRGALDMKGGVAMMVSAVLRAAREGVVPDGDIVLALVSDEESGGRCGARFLVEEHPDLLYGVRYAIGEFGGFPLRIRGRTFSMIQVAEKTPLAVDIVVRGPAGHGSRPLRGGAMAKLGRILRRLDTQRLPVHITPVTRRMVNAMAAELPPATRIALRQILRPGLTDGILAAMGEMRGTFEPLFHNTVNATIVRGGERLNVVPDEIHLGLDARLLPGCTTDDFLDELEPILRGDGEARIPEGAPSAPEVDFGLFELLGEILRERTSDAAPVPYLLPASTDGRHLARLGIQTYGFTPMDLPPDVSFFSSIHAVDERIPSRAVEFGTDVLFDLVCRYTAPVVRR
jgi:acetylornithine deacetylase/succinyl-diaminopimelate desuccinylase-like protein